MARINTKVDLEKEGEREKVEAHKVAFNVYPSSLNRMHVNIHIYTSIIVDVVIWLDLHVISNSRRLRSCRCYIDRSSEGKLRRSSCSSLHIYITERDIRVHTYTYICKKAERVKVILYLELLPAPVSLTLICRIVIP